MVEPDRNTILAADRTVLAAERTYAAWVRTGLAALAAGVGARALLAPVLPGWLAVATAAMLVMFAGFAFLAGAWREIGLDRQLPEHDLPRLPASYIIIANGFLVMVSVAVLAGIFMAHTLV